MTAVRSSSEFHPAAAQTAGHPAGRQFVLTQFGAPETDGGVSGLSRRLQTRLGRTDHYLARSAETLGYLL